MVLIHTFKFFLESIVKWDFVKHQIIFSQQFFCVSYDDDDYQPARTVLVDTDVGVVVVVDNLQMSIHVVAPDMRFLWINEYKHTNRVFFSLVPP